MKNLRNTGLAVMLLVFTFITFTNAADQTITYQVSTEVNELALSQTTNGAKYSIGSSEIYTNEEGYPELPYRIITLALPANTEAVSVEATGANIINVANNIEMAWFEGDIETSIYSTYTPALKNQTIYQSSNLYPGQYAEITGSGCMGSQPLATVAIFPLQYRPSTGEVILVRDIEINLILQSKNITTSQHANPGSVALKSIVENPEDLTPDYPVITSGGGLIPGGTIMGLGAEYLVITSAELAPAFYPFITWKNQKGIFTEIVLIEDILASYTGVDDAEKLREYLKDAYSEGAQYALLGGDETIIPIRYAYPFNTSGTPVIYSQYITDLYYADLTGEWDADGDGVFGETVQDDADIYPEIYVGRVAAESVSDVQAWVTKLLLYEQNPNNGDYAYLTKGLFISADQLRDGNEHGRVAVLMPANFDCDTSRCIEQPSGSSQSPTQPTAEQVIETMNEGWGYIANFNHGDYAFYATQSPGNNQVPRSDLYGDTLVAGNGNSGLTHMIDNTAYGVQYSISCYNASYDFDQEIYVNGPFLTTNTYMESFLFLPNKGGVAYLGNTREGIVGRSYKFEKNFVQYAYSDTIAQLGVAEAISKLDPLLSTSRKIMYSHNLFGDPEMKMWKDAPIPLTMNAPVEISPDSNSITIEVATASGAASNVKVTVWKPGEIYYRGYTDSEGRLTAPLYASEIGAMYVTADAQGYLPAIDTVIVGSLVGIDDDENENTLPEVTSLAGNYPNPFNASTKISYSLASASKATLEIFDIGGRKVTTLVEENMTAGEHSVIWNGVNESGTQVASGAYFYRLKTDTDNITKKLVLLK